MPALRWLALLAVLARPAAAQADTSLQRFFMTTLGGIALGEMFHRVGASVRNNQARGTLTTATHTGVRNTSEATPFDRDAPLQVVVMRD